MVDQHYEIQKGLQSICRAFTSSSKLDVVIFSPSWSRNRHDCSLLLHPTVWGALCVIMAFERCVSGFRGRCPISEKAMFSVFVCVVVLFQRNPCSGCLFVFIFLSIIYGNWGDGSYSGPTCVFFIFFPHMLLKKC